MDGECILMASPLFSISRKYENETKYTPTTRLWPSFICINSTISWNIVKKDREFHDSRDDTSLCIAYFQSYQIYTAFCWEPWSALWNVRIFLCVEKIWNETAKNVCNWAFCSFFLWNSKLMVQNANGSIKAFVWLWYKPFSLYEMPNVPWNF